MARASNPGAWIAWILATAVAGGTGFILAAYLVHIRFPDTDFSSNNAPTGDSLLPQFAVLVAGLLLIAGPLIAFSQGLVLRTFIHYKQWVLFAVAGAFGVGVAALVSLFAAAFLGSFALVMAPGLVYGMAQWLVFRNSTKQASWWVVVNTIGWIVAVILSFLLLAILPHDNLFGLPFYPLASVLVYATATSVLLAIFAGFTGAALFSRWAYPMLGGIQEDKV